jgi:O-antigen/teichoic acid export membrane protein
LLSNIKITVKGSAIYAIGNISLKLVGLILLPLYVQKLSLTEYGILGILDITSQALIPIFGLSIWNALQRWYWDKDFADRQKSIFFTVIAISTILAVVLYVLVSSLSSPLSNLLFKDEQYGYVIKLMALIASIEIVAQSPAMLYRLKNKPLFFTLSFITKMLVTLSLTLYFMIVKGKKIDGIYEAQLIGSAVYIIILIIPALSEFRFRFEGGVLKDMIRYRMPLVVSTVFVIVLSMTDRYALGFITNLDEVGIYSLGYKIANALKLILISSVWYALNPLIYKMMDQPGHLRFYSKIMTYFTFGVMVFLLAVSLFGKEVIYLVASKPEFRGAYKIIPFISFAILFEMLKNVALIGVHITKKTKRLALIVGLIALLNLGLNILLIPFLKSFGAAFATVLSQLVFFILALRIAQKLYYIPYEIKKIAQMIFLGLALVILGNLFNGLYLPLRLLLKTLIIGSFPFILYFLNFYEEIEMQRLKQIWMKWRNPLEWKRHK